MSPRRHQPKNNLVKAESSPWTEPFQQSHTEATAAASAAKPASQASKPQSTEDQHTDQVRDALLAVDPRPPAVALGDVADDSQPQTRPALAPDPRLVDLVEALEDSVQVRGRDAHTLVSDRHLEVTPHHPGANGDRGPRG